MNYPAASSGVSTISNRFLLAASCGELDPKEIKMVRLIRHIQLASRDSAIYSIYYTKGFSTIIPSMICP